MSHQSAEERKIKNKKNKFILMIPDVTVVDGGDGVARWLQQPECVHDYFIEQTLKYNITLHFFLRESN